MQVHAQHIARRVLPGNTGHDLARHITLGGHGGVLGGLAVVDFVAAGSHARERRPGTRELPEGCAGALHGLGRLEHGDQRQQAQAGRVAVDALGVDQRLAQHLQAAAHTQHGAALPRVRGDGLVQPLRAQPGQVGGGGFGTRQHDPVRWPQARHVGRAAHPLQAQAGHVLERLKFIEVADARVGHHGHGGVHGAGRGVRSIERRRAAPSRESPLGGQRGHASAERGGHIKHTVFLGQAVVPLHGNGGHGGHAGALLQVLRRGREQAGIAPELVEHEAVDQRPLVLGQ